MSLKSYCRSNGSDGQRPALSCRTRFAVFMRVRVGGASRSPLASPTGEEKRLVRVSVSVRAASRREGEEKR
jgi:hypothetical protein